MIHLQPSRRPDYPGAAEGGTEDFKGAYPGDKPLNRHNSMEAHPLRMRITRKGLIAVRRCGYLAAEYRIEIGPGSTAGVKVAVVHRRRQLDRGDGAQSRFRGGWVAAEQVIAQRRGGADLGKLRGADRNTVVDTVERHERLLADAR